MELDGRKDASSGTRATYSGRHAKADSKPKNDKYDIRSHVLALLLLNKTQIQKTILLA